MDEYGNIIRLRELDFTSALMLKNWTDALNIGGKNHSNFFEILYILIKQPTNGIDAQSFKIPRIAT